MLCRRSVYSRIILVLMEEVGTCSNGYARSVHKFEPMHRGHLLSMKKLFLEGSLEESKVILGWDLDFRHLTAELSEDKFQ